MENKKLQFWLLPLGIILIIFGFINLLSKSDVDDVPIQATRNDYADLYIQEVIQSFKPSLSINEQKIVKFGKVSVLENILPTSVELWALEYRLQPNNIEQVDLAEGMEIIDGWLTEQRSVGKPLLVFAVADEAEEKVEYLGVLYTGEYVLETLASQEIALRQLLEKEGLLPAETFNSEHIMMQFPLSTGETSQLFLSQPAEQGEHGIWTVERWMDGQGTIYYQYPATEISIMDYYQELQIEINQGHKPWMLDAAQVALDFIKNNLGQRQVNMDDLRIFREATIEDFLEAPVSEYLGFITNFEKQQPSQASFYLERVEWLTVVQDEKRLKALGIDPDSLPNGFYIHHLQEGPLFFQVTDETQYFILDWEKEIKSKSVDLEEFITNLEGYLDYTPPFRVITKDGYVQSIGEQYVP